jgi:hypothetical protein
LAMISSGRKPRRASLKNQRRVRRFSFHSGYSQVFFNNPDVSRVIFHKNSNGRTPAQCLNTDVSRTCKQVQETAARYKSPQDIKEGFFHPVGCRSYFQSPGDL